MCLQQRATTVLYVIVIIFTLISGSGCTMQDSDQFDIGDGGLLSNDPCGPPCFLEIKPGISTEDDVTELIEKEGLTQKCSFFDNSQESGSKSITCSNNMIFSFQDSNIVSRIGFRPTKELVVKEVIEKFGNPNAVLVTNQSTPESLPYTVMIIFFDNLNTNMVLPQQQSLTYHLSPNVKIESIGYSDMNSYKMMRQYHQDWKGYVFYEPYNP